MNFLALFLRLIKRRITCCGISHYDEDLDCEAVNSSNQNRHQVYK